VQRTRLHNTLGLWHKDRGRYQQAQECFEAAHTQAADNKPLRRIVLHNLANVFTRVGKRSQALPIYLEAIKLAEELGDEGGLARLQGDLGGLYLRAAIVNWRLGLSRRAPWQPEWWRIN
jgi:tetratricopeptide (TPR) repeat protein